MAVVVVPPSDSISKERGAAWSFVSFSLEKEVMESWHFTLSPRRGKDGSGSRRESKMVEEENRGDGGYRDADDEEETNTARSFVSFSSKKETKEPWPPSLLYL